MFDGLFNRRDAKLRGSNVGIGPTFRKFVRSSGGSGGVAPTYTPALKFNNSRNSQYWMFFI
jgi:hypothetical protein